MTNSNSENFSNLSNVNGLPDKLQQIFAAVSAAALLVGQQTFVIGGFVRDFYLKNGDAKLPTDIDFVTVGSGEKLAKEVARQLNTKKINIYKRFGTAQVHYKDLDLEFVGARMESYRADSRKPIVENGSLEDDQLRRDFTINALSWSLNKPTYGLLNDPFNGLNDLKNGIIRTPLEPIRTFSDDPLRMLRAIRFATQFNFSIDPKTFDGIKQTVDRIEIISAERISEELNKIIACEKPSRGFVLLLETGLLQRIFPEMTDLLGVETIDGEGHKDNFWHTLEVLDNVAENSNSEWLRWAAILHDIAKPPTKKFVPGIGWTFHGHEALGAKWVPRIFRRFSLPLDERMRYVKKLVRLHLRPIALVDEIVTDSAVRRLIFDAGEDIDDLMLLCRADITSKNDRKVKRFLKNFDMVAQKIKEVEEKDRIRNWQPPIDGLQIMQELNLEPGPKIGVVKKAIEEAILEGVISNDFESARTFMLENKEKWMNE